MADQVTLDGVDACQGRRGAGADRPGQLADALIQVLGELEAALPLLLGELPAEGALDTLPLTQHHLVRVRPETRLPAADGHPMAARPLRLPLRKGREPGRVERG